MTPHTTNTNHSQSSWVWLPRLDDDAVIQIHDFIHQVLDIFEARYGDQIRRFYQDLGGQEMLPGMDAEDDLPF